MKSINPYSQESQLNLHRINAKKITPRQIKAKLLKIIGKKKKLTAKGGK